MWPHDLDHEMTLPTQILGSVIEASISFCICSVFMLSSLGIGLVTGFSCSGVLPTVYMINNLRINYKWEQAREPNLPRQEEN
jgi:hypothetical protein